MRKIEFIAPFRHADDGVTIKSYEAGKTYEVSESCAEAALHTKAGREPGKSPAGGEAGEDAGSSSSAPAQAPEAKTSAPSSNASRPKPRKSASRR